MALPGGGQVLRALRVGSESARRRVVFGHGLGDTPHGWAQVCAEWHKRLPWIQFVLPPAPVRETCFWRPGGGSEMPSWYDLPAMEELQRMRSRLEVEAAGIDDAAAVYRSLMLEPSSTVLAGFSQGAAVALYTGLWHRLEAGEGEAPLAGILSMSGYLPAAKRLEEQIARTSKEGQAGKGRTPVLVCHGERDQVVELHSAELSKEWMERHAAELVSVRVQTFPHMGHEACAEEVDLVAEWLAERLPEPGPPKL